MDHRHKGRVISRHDQIYCRLSKFSRAVEAAIRPATSLMRSHPTSIFHRRNHYPMHATVHYCTWLPTADVCTPIAAHDVNPPTLACKRMTPPIPSPGGPKPPGMAFRQTCHSVNTVLSKHAPGKTTHWTLSFNYPSTLHVPYAQDCILDNDVVYIFRRIWIRFSQHSTAIQRDLGVIELLFIPVVRDVKVDLPKLFRRPFVGSRGVCGSLWLPASTPTSYSPLPSARTL
jgi:hypothetical protein